MRNYKLMAALLAVFFVAQIVAMPAMAKWSGALIVTREYLLAHEPLTVYTVAIDYAIKDWWYADLIIDTHPVQGVDADLSTTIYLPELSSKFIYVSAGIRGGLWHSARPPTLYVSMAFRF